MQNNWIKTSCVIGLVALSQLCFASEVFYYRYKDADGHQVITSTLPSDVADKGYEIISPRGNVIKTIQPIKTHEEVEADQKALEVKRQADLKAIENKKNEERQAKKDDILLKSFTNKEDIVRSRDEKIASIEVLEQIMHENISRLQKQLKAANESKVTFEKSGQPIPESLKNTITNSERQIKDNEAFLERKKIEKENIQTKYQGLITRFDELNKAEEQPTKSTENKQVEKTSSDVTKENEKTTEQPKQ